MNKYSLLAIFFLSYTHTVAAISPAEKSILKHENPTDNSQTPITGTIDQVIDNGSIIKLDNGTKWRVNPIDEKYTSGWLGPAKIEIKKAKDNNQQWPYVMINKWTNTPVRVSKLT